MASVEKTSTNERGSQDWPGVTRPATWFFRGPEEPIPASPPRRRPARAVLKVAVPIALGLLLVAGASFMLTSRIGAADDGRSGAGLVLVPARQNQAASFSQVAASGSTVVAVGSDSAADPAFMVSADAGRTFRPAATRGAVSQAGHPASLVAGGPGGWVAFGPRAIWDSADGKTWTLVSVRGPATVGDTATAVTRTGSGFLATGTNVRAGTGVVWTSPNGVVWHRFSAAQFGLIVVPGEQVFAMTGASTVANTTMIVGSARVGTNVCAYIWLTSDGGASWRTVVVPMGHGARATFAGLAGTPGNFIAVRPGVAADGRRDALVYTSADAVTWSFKTAITAPGGFGPSQVTAGSGATAKLVIAGTDDRGNRVAYTSLNQGATWTRSTGFGVVPVG